MNENDSKVELVSTETNETEATVEQTGATEEKVEKTETPEAKVARLKRQLRREQQKLGVAEEEIEEAKYKPKSKPFELGYEHKAFLNANQIRGKDEYALVQEYIQNTGKELEEVIESKFFQAELKELRGYRDSRAASDAASGSKRGANSAQDTVDYWLAKGDDALPPPYMTQLRRDVVNARIKKHSNNSPFRN